MKFKTIAQSGFYIERGKFEYELFTDSLCDNKSSVIDNTESEIVNYIFKDSMLREHLISEICHAKYHYYLNVYRGNIISGSQSEVDGDFDAIIIENNDFSRAISIEFKRIKYEYADNGEIKINGLEKITTKLIKQGNLSKSKGFYKTYICIITLVDSKVHKTPNTILRHKACEKYIEKVYKPHNFAYLDASVGIIFLEIEQPTSKDIVINANISICCDRLASEQSQASEITCALKAWSNKRCC